MDNSSEDTDSSPRASSSSSSSSSGGDILGTVGAMPATDQSAHPDSPGAANHSSDESGSSDGVLVELPGSSEQDCRTFPREPDSGVLVNIDGSMQEQQDREDLFMDASDHLGSGGRTPRPEESMAVVEVGDTPRRRRSRDQDLERFQAQLNASGAECWKYKEEREAFGRELLALRCQLQFLNDQQYLNSEDLVEYQQRLDNRETEHDVLASPTPLHSMVNDCSKLVTHLKDVFNERVSSRGVLLRARDQEIEDLNVTVLEYDMFRDVILSYLGSAKGEWSQYMSETLHLISRRLSVLLASVEAAPSHELFDGGIAMVEQKTMLLVEKQKQLLFEIDELGQLLESVKPGCLASRGSELGCVFAVAREELLESKKKKGDLADKIRELEEGNRKMVIQITDLKEVIEESNAEVSKTKTELEHAESRFLATKEKLGIAVTKGKALVQHRDSLKQSLAEKTTELEKCMLELQQKACALEAMERSTGELKLSLSHKTSDLENCLLELQVKSDLLTQTEATVEELNHLLREKTSEFEKCLLEVQLKSDALDTCNANAQEVKQLLALNEKKLESCLLESQQKSNNLEIIVANVEELKQSLVAKGCELEKCLMDLEHKSYDLEKTEAIVQELRQSLAEKDVELEKCLLEFHEKSAATLNTSMELCETKDMVCSLQELASSRAQVLEDLGKTIQGVDFPLDLLSLTMVDKVRWLVNQTSYSNKILQANDRVKDALFSLNLPDDISSAELDSQIRWLVQSFMQSKDKLNKLQSDVTHARESSKVELIEALKEVESLASSLLKEKQEKEILEIELEDLKVSHKKLAKDQALIYSEKERLIKLLNEVSASTLDDQSLSSDMDMIEQCIIDIGQKIKSSLTCGKNLERMQNLLHIAYAEKALFEEILEEMLLDGSKLETLADELGRASEEVRALRNEKENVQKEIERLEERNSLLRDKLSMAVKKGKGLLQEREGLKNTLDERNSEIEKLKKELEVQECKAFECMEQIQSLSTCPEKILKLEVDIASLKERREQLEDLLYESKVKLQKLVDSINDIVLYTDKTFEQPIEKVEWIGWRINEIESYSSNLEQELEKVKDEAAFASSRLADVLETVQSLSIQLNSREKHVKDVEDEMNHIQQSKTNLEEELNKKSEESFMLEKKLAEACTTIKSLEGELLLAEEKAADLEAEKNEIVSNSKHEIIELNTKLAECVKELTQTQGISENQSAELHACLKQLQIFMKNEGLFPIMIEQFHKMTDSLRKIWLIVLDIHDNFVAEGSYVGHEIEQVPDFANLSSVLNFEDFMKNEVFHREARLEDAGDVTSCKKVVENFYEDVRLLNDRFNSLSRYMDDHILLTLQSLQTTKAEIIQTLHLCKSLNLSIQKLEHQNQSYVFEISSFQNEALRLLSACNDATRELNIQVRELSDYDSELEKVHSDVEFVSQFSSDGGEKNVDISEYVKAADKLLLTCRKIGMQSQNLLKINKDMSASMDNLKLKLYHSELAAEAAIEEKNQIQEKFMKLEGDLEAVQNICNVMKTNLNDYQSKEETIKEKEAELMLLEHSLIAKDKGDELISKDQAQILFEKVNKLALMAGSFHIFESWSQESQFSSPLDKLFFVVDEFPKLQQGINSLTHEKEELQLIIATHAHELEDVKNSVNSIGVNYHDLELKRQELSEVTSILEKFIQKLTGNYSFDDLKTGSVKGLLQILERQITSLSIDYENSSPNYMTLEQACKRRIWLSKNCLQRSSILRICMLEFNIQML
ncbi:hypothetical protein HPP92_009696 [Vanilla planifolia]|uniref:Centromere-associated protein E n=1 Tax=Vanilla planifolia TaxID=51239 RepID=A0A835V935_VANPL|nr:hypothetical protein HPP92_009696 [Vanilla planifolia]